MARNVELKARVEDLESVVRRAEALADGPAEILVQHDTFYHVPEGRLKMRVFPDGTGQLISYCRANERGPKTSEYFVHKTESPASLETVLAHSLGVRCVVDKQRTLFLNGRTRIHLDRVEGLGDFLELEVVLEDDENEEVGVQMAKDLLARLGLSAEDLLAGAYADLLFSEGETR